MRTDQAVSFKICQSCAFLWETRDDFLKDRNIKLIGYQVNFKALRLGLVMFNHACGTTLALKVESFTDLYSGPVFRENLTGSRECPEFCLNQNELRACPARCECVYVRKILQVINNWPKDP